MKHLQTFPLENQLDNQRDEPDLTPMLDVVFIMLIFFIVTATFVKEHGLELPANDSKPNMVSANESVVIEIRGDDRFYVNKKATDKRLVQPYVTALLAAQPGAGLVIVPEQTAKTAALAHALDVSNLLGVRAAISIPKPD